MLKFENTAKFSLYVDNIYSWHLQRLEVPILHMLWSKMLNVYDLKKMETHWYDKC